MPKNYIINYLSALHAVLTDAAAGIDGKIANEDDGGDGTKPHVARVTMRDQIVFHRKALDELETDAFKMTYGQFEKKYLK